MRYAACVEYDGSGFSGWQAQKKQKNEVRTVQSVVQTALSKVADHPISIITAGRTDAGVHASHQVIHFESDALRSEFSWCRGTNRFMPKDVRLRWVQVADAEFHARFSALSRSYRYIINNKPIQSAIYRRHVTSEFKPLDAKLMAVAGQVLLGEHDFSSFRAAGCQAHSPVRTISEFNLASNGSWIWFDVTANAFLQHMVRNIAGALIEVGCGKRDLEWMTQVLQAKDRTKGGITAAASGLYLVGVTYPSEFAMQSCSQQISFWG
jgi:tRNA pseudouridine38-40 synthase